MEVNTEVNLGLFSWQTSGCPEMYHTWLDDEGST